MRNPVLGRGLSALLKDEIIDIHEDRGLQTVNIQDIEPGIYQPRKKFEQEKIKELAESILENGLLQPIIITKSEGDSKYKIIAGERRWRACKLAGFDEVPVIIKDLSSEKILEIALIENIQREELSAIEEAEGYLKLIQEFGYSQETISRKLGKSRSHIANLLRLNTLPSGVKKLVISGQLSMGHARCLVGHDHAEKIARLVIENDFSVRKTEYILSEWKKRCSNKSKNGFIEKSLKRTPKKISSDLKSIIKSLSERLKVKVTIEDYGKGGKLIFNYTDFEQLDNLLTKIS